jgi:hypothetical protein
MKVRMIVVLLVVSSTTFGQYAEVSHDAGALPLARIVLVDAQEQMAEGLFLSGDSVFYRMQGSAIRVSRPLSEVRRIERPFGNYGLTGTWVGGLVGAGLGFALAWSGKETKNVQKGSFIYEETTVQTWPIYVGALAGALTGGAVGRSSMSWEKVYPPER